MDYRSAALGFTFVLWLAAPSADAQSGDELAPPPPPASGVVAPAPTDAPPGDFVEGGEGPPVGAAPTAPEGYGQPGAQPQYVQPVQPQYAPPGQPQYVQPAYGRPQYTRRVRIRYREGMEVPPGAEVVERRKNGLWIAGLAVFGASYALSILVSTIDDELIPFAVPVVGPLIYQVRDGYRDELPLSILDTLAQTAGIVLFALGMRKSSYIESWATLPGGRRLAVIPRISRDQVGLSLTVF